jgi:hypothetical protein
MNIDEIKAKFLAEKCNEITSHVDLEKCQQLYSQFKLSLRKAGCKCKHKGITNSYLNQLTKLIK